VPAHDPHSQPPSAAAAPLDVEVSGDGVPAAAAPYWWEDPDLAAAVAEVEEFAGAAGWDKAPQMFALVRTSELLATQPRLSATLAGAGVFTPIAQDVLPAGDLSEALSQISWPDEVGGCVLVQEIVVLPPSAVDPAVDLPGGQPDGAGHPGHDVGISAEQAAAHPDRAEARLAAGVLRGVNGGACLLRVRGKDDDTPLRGADLAPNLLRALQATFDD
jgi:hypothetical protein